MVLSSEEQRRKSVVRRNFQTQRRKAAEFSFYEHKMHERNGSFSHKLLSPFRKTNKNHRKQSKTFLLMIFIPIFREITSCFRPLEKTIKTKEHKIKHLFLYVFIGFPLFFQKAKANSKSVYSVSSVFMFILTTDIQDFRDINHERKRDNPFNLCYLCSFK